jgi:hypothetical protein
MIVTNQEGLLMAVKTVVWWLLVVAVLVLAGAAYNFIVTFQPR